MIPAQLRNFTGFDAGRQILGVADIVLPNFQYMTESMAGAGMNGEIDSPTVGHFQSLTTTINWRSLTADNIRYTAPRTYHFDFRGDVQFYDEGSGDFLEQSVKLVLRCVPKGFNPGSFTKSSLMGTSAEYEILYVKLSITHRVVVEIDKLNYICKMIGPNGTLIDYLRESRRNLGLD